MMFLYKASSQVSADSRTETNAEKQIQLTKARDFYQEYQSYANQENFDPKVAVIIIQKANTAHYTAQSFGAPQDELFIDIETAVRRAELAVANLVREELKKKIEAPYEKFQNQIHNSFESLEKFSKQINGTNRRSGSPKSANRKPK